jgi:glycosyltransferase involved in cell wall biosynthesis
VLNAPHDDGPLRVLLAVDSLEMGGAERHVAEIAVELARRGHVVTVGCSASGMLADRLRQGKVDIRVCAKRRAKRVVSREYAGGLGRVLRHGGYDVVHAHLYASAAAVAMAVRRTPLVVTEHSQGGWRRARERAISRAYLQRADGVVAVSAAVGREVRGLGVDDREVVELPNAVTRLSHMHPRLPESDGPIIGFVGRFCKEKGADLFIELAASIASAWRDARFLMIGDGPMRKQLEVRAGQWGIDRRVLFMGEVANARSLLAEVDVLVVPSRTEGAPLVVLEAMAAGTPVVGSRVGGIPEQIRDGEDGLLVTPGDIGGFVTAVNLLIEHPSLRGRLATGGRERERHRSFEEMVGRLEAMYRAAMLQGRRAAGSNGRRMARRSAGALTPSILGGMVSVPIFQE